MLAHKKKSSGMYTFILILLFFGVVAAQCFGIVTHSFLLYNISRLLIIPIIFLLSYKDVDDYSVKRYFFVGFLLMFVADIFTVIDKVPIINIGFSFSTIAVLVFGYAILLICSLKNKMHNYKLWIAIGITLLTSCSLFLIPESIHAVLIIQLILHFVAVLLVIYQSFLLKSKFNMLANNYFLPFSFFCFVHFIILVVDIYWGKTILHVLLSVFYSLYLFVLAMGVKKIK